MLSSLRPRDAAILQRIVVVADALQIGPDEAPAGLGTPAVTAGVARAHVKTVLRVTRAGLLGVVAIGASFPSFRRCGR
jgi:hypothetical protein